MSQQLRITVPLPPMGSEYMLEFEQHFKANVPPAYLEEVLRQSTLMKEQTDCIIGTIYAQLQYARTPYDVTTLIMGLRNEKAKYQAFMDASPLPPSIDEIAAMVILATYFFTDEDADMVLAEMKCVIMKRFTTAHPNVDKESLLRLQELLDQVFNATTNFYTGNKVSHNYIKGLAQHFDMFVPAYIGCNKLGGLDVIMMVDDQAPKLTPAEAYQMEQTGRLMNMGVA